MIVVDDRAPDADVPPTEPPDERMILLHHARHRGRGAAVRTGLAHIRDVLLPADLPPEDWEDGHPRPGSALIAIMAASTVFLAEDLDLMLDAARRQENRKRLVVGVRHPDRRRSFFPRLWNGFVRCFPPAGAGACSHRHDGASRLRRILPFPKYWSWRASTQTMNCDSSTGSRGTGTAFCEVELRGDLPHARKNRRIVLDSVRLHLRAIRFTGSSMFSSLLEYGVFCLLHYFLRDGLPHTGDAIAIVVSRLLGNGCNY